MTIYVSTTLGQHGSKVSEVVDQLLAEGISHIELGSIHRDEPKLAETLRKAPARFLTHNFFPPLPDRNFILNFTARDKAERAASIAYAKSAIDFALEIGAEIYTVHPGFIASPKGESQAGDAHYDFQFSGQGSVDLADRSDFAAWFFEAVRALVDYIGGRSLRLAIETQGSFEKPGAVLFSRPEEFLAFMEAFGSEDRVGINLNLAHVYLSSRYYGFDPLEAIALLKPKVLAVEISHSDGIHDNHEPLASEGWYYEYLDRFDFSNSRLILETREASVEQIKHSIALLRSHVSYLRS